MGIARTLVLTAALLGCTLSLAEDEHQLASGTWHGSSYAIDGGWQLIERGGETFIVFDDQFHTRRGPDLKVYLSRKRIELLRDNSVEPNSVKIAPLRSRSGRQEYWIPSDLDIKDFASVVIHCEAYSHLWGGANL